MELPSYFTDFLENIRPTQNQRGNCKTGHETLRKRLEDDDSLSSVVVATFLQGSYRRATAIRVREGKRSDVDIIAVTDLSEEDYPNPGDAMKKFVPFLSQHYKGNWKTQGHSFRINMDYVALDLVITSAPSESEVALLMSHSVVRGYAAEELEEMSAAMGKARQEPDWKLSPLRIPDREAGRWEDTHPLEQIRWTWGKNRRCNGHYVNVVKAIKWWRRVNHAQPEHPKGYPLEHLIGDCCPDGTTSVAEGVTQTLETIAEAYQGYASLRQTPVLWDRGVRQDVFKRISGDDFALFHSQVCNAAQLARQALDAEDLEESARAWRHLFGEAFPEPRSTREGQGGYTRREEPSIVSRSRFA